MMSKPFHYAVDIETLDFESTAVVLSVSIVWFDLETDKGTLYKDLLARAFTVKFNAEDQIEKYKRTVDENTVEWWAKKTSKEARVMSFIPNPNKDHLTLDGLNLLEHYLFEIQKETRKEPPVFWMRGSLDQLCLDSLTLKAGKKPLVPFNNWRDFRTAIDLLATDSSKGYCKIEGFDAGKEVLKHCPDHDCAYDIFQLLNLS